MSNRLLLAAWISACLMTCGALAHADELLKVHEWGTFTSFQDEEGHSFTGINTDDEPVPKFVHQLFYQGHFAPTQMPPRQSQGADRAFPDVTMRLETPVTYFHLPPSQQEMTLDVSVQFRGGWLTQFYPQAASKVDGREVNSCQDVDLRAETVGGLSWRGVKLGHSGNRPETNERVWLAPRNVAAAEVTVGDESERFLFYRGVGHLDAPLRVVRQGSDRSLLELYCQTSKDSALATRPTKLSHSWLLEVRPDGASAFRTLPEMVLDATTNAPLITTPATFSAGDFSKENLSSLRASMHRALKQNGLFADEAEALLKTWELSYFLSPGERLLFIVPAEWTNEYLPLTISVPAEVNRVMVGRIELVTPRQRELLAEIAESPVPSLAEVTKALTALESSGAPADREKYNALSSGRGNAADLGVPVPESYQAFLALGRFRTTLLLAAARDRRDLPFTPHTLGHFAMEVEIPGKGVFEWKLEKDQIEQALKRRRARVRPAAD